MLKARPTSSVHIFLLAIGLLLHTCIFAQSLPVTGEERDLNKPIRVGISEVFFPHSYLDSDGQLKGFAVDLLNAVARTMDLKIERVPVKNTQMTEAFRSGQIDMIQSWSETPKRHAFTSFSTPYLRCETVIVAHKNSPPIQSAEDLNGLQVAVGQIGNVGDLVLDQHAPQAHKVFRESSSQFLALLNEGGCDAAVLSRLTAASLAKRDGLNNLRILDAKLQGYDVRYCFAVRRGDDRLLARVNEGLAILNRTGEFEKIYNKWFGAYEPARISQQQLLSAVAALLAIVSVFISVAFLRQRRLSTHISTQATELARQRALLAALHDNHPLASIVLDLPPESSPLLISYNQQAAQLLTIPPSVPEATPLRHLSLASDAQPFFDEVLSHWHTRGQPRHWELNLAHSKKWLEVFIVPLGSGTLDADRICILAGDITARRSLDNEVSLSRRQRALGELVGGVAHEFNNLLTPILATASQLREERHDDGPLIADLHTIEEAARRGAALTRRLLTFGRRSDDHASPVRLSDAVSAAIDLLRHTIDRRISLQIKHSTTTEPLLFNQTDLHQIIFNLLINARDTLNEKLSQSSPQSGDWKPSIEIEINSLPSSAFDLKTTATERSLAGWQTLSVHDNGMGIPPEVLDRIFEPFFTTKEVGTGSGLGLATTWHIINECGGHIDIDSKPGEYTCFRICLPRWVLPLGEANTTVARPPSRPLAAVPIPPSRDHQRASHTHGPFSAPTPATPRRIMLVEDEDAVAKVIARILERLGHQVTRFHDGLEAWEYLCKPSPEPFDTLLLDMNMPRMNGLDLARRIKTSDTPGRLVVMSGRVSEAELSELRDLGVAKVYTKPVTVDTLREAVG